MKSRNRFALPLALQAFAWGCGGGEGGETSLLAARVGRVELGSARNIPDDSGCVPACVNKRCGLDGCDGSCGTCPFGSTCSAGQCEGGSCVEGETACDPARVTSILACRSHSWQAQACPVHQLCSNKKCREVCDGWLDASVPTVCFVPHWESHQIFLYSNDATRLGPDHTQFGIANKGNPAEIDWDTSQPWPDVWKLDCLTGMAWVYFRLNQLGLYCGPTVQFVLKMKKAPTTARTTRWEVDFWSATERLAVSQGEVPAAFQTYVVGLSYPFNATLSLDGRYNLAHLHLADSGTSAACEPVLLNWVVLQVIP